MPHKTAKADVTPVRQRTQYSCMACSLMMCLQANGVDCDENEVNHVMGARPRKGASWESALAAAQHYGMRATLTTPATVQQLKDWTDRGVPIMIAWNPEGREWSHASVVFDVTRDADGELYVHVADPNIPNPEKTTRVLSADDFYSKWYEKWPDYLVRRPACAIEPEITPDGRQVMASQRAPVITSSVDWYHLVPNADAVLVSRMQQMAEEEGVEATNPIDAAKMLAWESGYAGESLVPWFKQLGRQLRVNVIKEHKEGLEVGRNNKYAGEGSPRKASVQRIAGHFRQAASGRSPNQVGSSSNLKRQGLTPVDIMFGEPLPHRRPTVMPGELVQDKQGKLWFFVGVDERGKAVLAKTKRKMEQMADQLLQDRLHHSIATIVEPHMSSRKRKPTQEVRNKKDPNAPLRAPGRKPRDDAARDLAEGRVNIRMGPHMNKPQRGTGAKGKGKTQRHPKHRRDLRQQRQSASSVRVAYMWLEAKRADMGNGRLDSGLRSKINKALRRGGLDGNGRFRKASHAYSKALEILADFGVELDTVVSSHLFNRPSGTLQIEVAFTNDADPFSPVSITNSVLFLQFTELREGMFEAIAYMS